MAYHSVKCNIHNLKFTSKSDSNGVIVTTISADAKLAPPEVGTLALIQTFGNLQMAIDCPQETMDFNSKTVNTEEQNQADESKPLFALTDGEKETAEDGEVKDNEPSDPGDYFGKVDKKKGGKQ